MHIQNVESVCGPETVKLICGNKCDLENERRVPFDDLIDKAATHEKILYQETSAVSSRHETIEQLFHTLCTHLAKLPQRKSTAIKLH